MGASPSIIEMSPTPKKDAPTELPLAGERHERADAAANRARILEAARAVLAERGAEGTSLDAVAAAAEVGKGTIFRRFGDRSGLFEALLSDHLAAFQEAFLFGPPPLGPGATPIERLRAFFDGFLELQDGHLELTIALEKEKWRGPIGGYLVLSMHVENLLREVSSDIDAATTAQLLMNAAGVNVVRYLRRDIGVSLASIKDAMHPLLDGLSSQA